MAPACLPACRQALEFICLFMSVMYLFNSRAFGGSLPSGKTMLCYDRQSLTSIRTSMLELGSRDSRHRSFTHPAVLLSVPVELLRRRYFQQRKKGRKKRGKRGGLLIKSKKSWASQRNCLVAHMDYSIFGELRRSWLIPVEPNGEFPAHWRC